jgi:glyoxylate reductase
VSGRPVILPLELRDLLQPAWLDGLEPTWISLGDAVPKGDFAGIVPLPSRWVGGTELKHLPKLKVIANFAVGFDNVDLVAAEMRGVAVTNTPDVLTDACADLTWALILACARRVVEGDRLVRSGTWRGFEPTLLLGLELRGATLGILGAGRIGRAVGRRAVGFGMRILYAARAPKPEFEHETGARRADWKTLLRESDVLTLHAPLTPETKGLIDDQALAAMKPDAILVNTARGGLIREEYLADALDRGHLRAVGLDVFQQEPDINPRILAAPRTVLLPHLGSASEHARRRMADIAMSNLRAVLDGRPAPNPVYR